MRNGIEIQSFSGGENRVLGLDLGPVVDSVAAFEGSLTRNDPIIRPEVDTPVVPDAVVKPATALLTPAPKPPVETPQNDIQLVTKFLIDYDYVKKGVSISPVVDEVIKGHHELNNFPGGHQDFPALIMDPFRGKTKALLHALGYKG